MAGQLGAIARHLKISCLELKSALMRYIFSGGGKGPVTVEYVFVLIHCVKII